MEDYLNDPWMSAGIVFVAQILFLFFRTLNLKYIADSNVLMSIVTGNGIGVSWLISTTMGVNSISMMSWPPIAAFLIGGSIGTYVGIISKNKKKGK